ncbi:MAG: class I SAM-dependent RNA methyltransferase [Coriobacteriia bacterium]|nr:class I SAM-dependent RNA methyltransferase [Coriobacteriia bacterium]
MALELSITDLAYTGYGLGHLEDGRVAFVSGAVPGDQMRVNITQDKGRYVFAEPAEILTPSDDRLPAVCPHADECGGCPWQAVSYPVQLDYKWRFVVSALGRTAKVKKPELLVSEIEPSKKCWGYRNKMEFGFGRRSEGLRLGIHRPRSNQLVPIKRCLLLPVGSEDLPRQLSGSLNYLFAEALPLPYRIQVRISERSGFSELALWSLPGPLKRGFVAQVLSQVKGFQSIVRVLTKTPKERQNIKKVEVLQGRGHWLEDFLGFRLRVSAPSFFQVNTPVAEQLVGYAIEQLEPAGAKVWDLYCGVGSFTLPLIGAGARLSACEIAGSSLRDLQSNLKFSSSKAIVESGDVKTGIKRLPKAKKAIIDPPRSGLSPEARQALIESSVRHLVYVSCDPQTLARDCAELIASGFTLNAAKPFDLFPQTYHVETVATLTR